MKKYCLFIVLALTTLLFSVTNSISVPKKDIQPVFSDVTVTSSDSHILLFATLDNGFTDGMVQGLHSGLPLHFSFFIELIKSGDDWRDEAIVSLETRHIISYDTLKENYRVEIEESGKRFYTFNNLKDAQKAAVEINGLRIVDLPRLQPKTSYTARIRAELYKKTLPMGLHEVVPFVSWWDIKTKWHSVSFTF